MRYPDLICIGAQKSATTWLHETLKKRKDLFLPRVKELNYFSQIYNEYAREFGPKLRARRYEKFLEFAAAREAVGKDMTEARRIMQHIARPDVDDAWYSAIFEEAPPSQKCVEVCPGYMILPEEGIRHVLRLAPDVSLVLLIRDPVERAWSHIRMKIARGEDSDETKELLSGRGELGLIATYSDYATSIRNWEVQTKPGQLRCYLYESVSTEPHFVISDLASTLGLPPSPPDDSLATMVFQGERVDFPTVLRAKLLEAFSEQYNFLGGRFPEAVKGWQDKHRQALAGAD